MYELLMRLWIETESFRQRFLIPTQKEEEKAFDAGRFRVAFGFQQADHKLCQSVSQLESLRFGALAS